MVIEVRRSKDPATRIDARQTLVRCDCQITLTQAIFVDSNRLVQQAVMVLEGLSLSGADISRAPETSTFVRPRQLIACLQTFASSIPHTADSRLFYLFMTS